MTARGLTVPEGTSPGSFRRGEIETLYRHTPSIVLANACGAVVVTVGLRAHAAPVPAFAWATSVLLFSVARLFVLSRRGGASHVAARSWARLFLGSSLVAGALWGLCPLVFHGATDSSATLLVSFVIGGLVAGAAGTLACLMPAFLAFSIPALVPLAARLASGGETGRLMALMVGVYAVLMTVVARNVNRALRSAFALQIANEELLARQADVNRLLEQNNHDLDRRVMERTAELRAHAERQRDAADLGCRALTDDNLEHIASRAAAALRRALALDVVSVFELLPDGRTLARRGVDGAGDDVSVLDATQSAFAVPRADGVAHSPLSAAALAETLVTTDGDRETRYADDPLATAFDAESFLCAALVSEGGALGVVFAGSRSTRMFGRDDTSYVQIIANVVAGAIAQRRAETARRRSQQLEAMGRIASGVAHEINTPMQFIAHSAAFVEEALHDLLRVYEAHERCVESLADEPAHAAEVASLRSLREATQTRYVVETIPKSLERIQLGVLRVSETVGATRRLGTGDTVSKHTDVNELVRSAAIITNHLTEHVAEVELSLGDVPRITAHPGELIQVFQNLIGNAADAIREKYGSGSRGLIKLSSGCRNGKVVVCVEDDGCGIPKAHLPRVFEPFYTTKDEKHGSGQGLAIARDIIERGHGGSISVKSEPGRRTAFTIEIPEDVAAPLSWRSVILAKDVTSLIPTAESIKVRSLS